MSRLSLRYFADGERADSFSNRMRSRRFTFFEHLVAEVGRPIRILDVGGTTAFWKHRGWANREDVTIVALNRTIQPKECSNITPMIGDALDLSEYRDGSFDVVFSNSVIEHVFTWENQLQMAAEIQRVGQAYWVQTPNFWFPIEPHFLVPGWQWLPREWRIGLLRRFRCGWRGPCPNVLIATKAVDEVQLLSKRRLRRAFPHATIRAERFTGLVKSWVAYDGFESLALGAPQDERGAMLDTIPFPVSPDASAPRRKRA